ncbi:hypothetical protein ACFLW0_05040 [Chloroflexota bacterium]
MKLVCPSCKIEGSMSLAQPSYEGPYRCWKCRELFTIRIEGNELKSCEPLSQEEFDRQQELQKEEENRQKELDALRNKFKRG